MLVRLQRECLSFRDGRLHSDDKIVLVKMHTEGHVDGGKLSFDRPVVVSGTFQYENTMGGTKTVFVLEEIDPEWLNAEVKNRMPRATVERIGKALDQARADREMEANQRAAAEKADADGRAAAAKAELEKKAAAEKAEADRKAAIEEAKWRMWTDSTGQFKTKAMFGGMAGGKVKLIKKDGSTVRVPLEKLSEEDQQWIKSKSH